MHTHSTALLQTRESKDDFPQSSENGPLEHVIMGAGGTAKVARWQVRREGDEKQKVYDKCSGEDEGGLGGVVPRNAESQES